MVEYIGQLHWGDIVIIVLYFVVVLAVGIWVDGFKRVSHLIFYKLFFILVFVQKSRTWCLWILFSWAKHDMVSGENLANFLHLAFCTVSLVTL